MSPVRACRQCGCTDFHLAPGCTVGGRACHWVAHDLCSACTTPSATADTTTDQETTTP